MALKTNGMVAAWGNNNLGQTNVPSGLNNIIDVKSGQSFSVVLKNNGTVAALGNNTNGRQIYLMISIM